MTREELIRKAVDAGLDDAGADGIDHFVTIGAAERVIDFITRRVVAALAEEEADG